MESRKVTSELPAVGDHGPHGEARDGKIIRLLAACAAVAIMWTLPMPLAAMGWGAWEKEQLGAPFISAALSFFVVPLLLALVTGGELGLNHRQPMRWLEIGCMALGVVGPLGGMAFALGADPRRFPLALVIALAYALCIPVMMRVLKKTRAVDVGTPVRRQALIGFSTMVVTLLLAVGLGWLPDFVRQGLHLLVMVGLGEEILFRGLLQGVLDELFGSRWNIGGARVGWGWIIQAVIFGASHPLMAQDPSLWGWALWTMTAGLAFGWIRARAGTILAPALVHGVVDVIGLVVVPQLLG